MRGCGEFSLARVDSPGQMSEREQNKQETFESHKYIEFRERRGSRERGREG